MSKRLSDVVMIPAKLFTEIRKLSYHAQLAVLNLIAAQWESDDGMLPCEDAALRAASGFYLDWAPIREEVLGFLRTDGVRCAEPLVLAEWQRQQHLRQRKQAGARTTNLRRYGVGLAENPQLIEMDAVRARSVGDRGVEVVNPARMPPERVKDSASMCQENLGADILPFAGLRDSPGVLMGDQPRGEKQGATPPSTPRESLLGPPASPFSYEIGDFGGSAVDYEIAEEAEAMRFAANFSPLLTDFRRGRPGVAR